MSSTESALLSAIAAMPEEDTPRLVFADYLDELGGAGNAARAEFIRLQVMLYRVESETHETIAARLLAAELYEEYSGAWGFPEQSKTNRWFTVRRGFVSELAIDFPRVPRDAIRRLLQHEPIGRLRLERPYDTASGWWTVPANGADWLDVPALRRVRHLELSGSYWTDRELARVLVFANFPALAKLTVTGAPITAAGVAAVAACATLRDLEYLRIDGTRQWSTGLNGWTGGVALPGVRALASAPVLAGLRELSLLAAGIDTVGAVVLAGSPYLTGLTAPKSLILAENPDIGASGRTALVARFGSAVFLSPPANP